MVLDAKVNVFSGVKMSSNNLFMVHAPLRAGNYTLIFMKFIIYESKINLIILINNNLITELIILPDKSKMDSFHTIFILVINIEPTSLLLNFSL